MDFDFEQNGTVDTLDNVPEKYRGLYAEGSGDAEGKFVLSDIVRPLVGDYVGAIKSVAGLRHEKKQVTDENANRRLAVKAVEDLAATFGLEVGDEGVASAIKVFVEDLQGQVKGGQQVKIDLDKIKNEFDRRVTEVTETKDKEISERDAALASHLISSVAVAALTEHKGSVELLLPHVQSHAEVVREDNGEYSVRIKDGAGSWRMNSAGGWMGVAELVAEMKTNSAFARAFDSEVKGGNNTPPGSMKQRISPHGNQDRELTPIEKIREGLKKNQHVQGSGAQA